ncbi:glycosyltransferase [Geomonas azotofigens]|uniref:glycosyltransferase n=1 Tax=Geomonas azotofigens TaxID=2843196 RepID=UPI001C0F86FE|nr:glycosyltransferase [Geomonas azotofigens]MBU5614580.1 glycosyltransferase [Geomonas azotofigens]
MPKVSVIMSVYNSERFLRQAIDSILAQSFRDFEFIIIDDGSTDGSAAIIRSYDDARIRIITQDNVGLTKSLNKAMKMAAAEYLARQDADDISEPGRLAKQVAVLDADPATVLVSGNLRYFSEAWSSATESNRAVPPLLVKWLLLFYNHVGGHSQVMFRRDVAVKLGGYDEGIRYSQDYDLWLRLAEAGGVTIVPEVLLNFRHHDANLSKIAAEEQQRQSYLNSAGAIARRSGVAVSPDDLRLLRKFWLKNSGGVSRAEAGRADLLFREILDGLFLKGHLSAVEKDSIMKFTALFFTFNAEMCSLPEDREALRQLGHKWEAEAPGGGLLAVHRLEGKFQ